ncbi:hypothetical protein L1D44_03115 [Shewanella sp. Isolate13]|uniref:hypothetical protein n=1 Tax=Shewanella sp. Isolate13 TaxID=2908531 RepID=UPI001EFE17E1|nr:hypothetical protein [Shewanella sp. Isolate13]MCG9728847.1 hypothetical protein [Shewanella sp. Isolate13]
MRCFLLFFFLLLTGCSATPIDYRPVDVTNYEASTAVIEQVVYEQPIKYRPSGIVVNELFIGFDYGVLSKTKSTGIVTPLSNSSALGLNSSSTELKNTIERYYFNSLSIPRLFKKREWYIIKLLNKNGGVVKNIYTRDETKAKSFINHISKLIVYAS